MLQSKTLSLNILIGRNAFGPSDSYLDESILNPPSVNSGFETSILAVVSISQRQISHGSHFSKRFSWYKPLKLVNRWF